MKERQQGQHRGAEARRGSGALMAVALLFCGSGCVTGVTLYPRVILTTAEGAYELDVLWLQTGQETPEFPTLIHP